LVLALALAVVVAVVAAQEVIITFQYLRLMHQQKQLQ
jgi:hypothetical protein